MAQVARRYAMNANLIFKWLRDERYTPEPDATAKEAEPVFLPVEIEAANSPGPALATIPGGGSRSSFLTGAAYRPRAGLMLMCWRDC